MHFPQKIQEDQILIGTELESTAQSSEVVSSVIDDKSSPFIQNSSQKG
jgi:hypothetical protein